MTLPGRLVSVVVCTTFLSVFSSFVLCVNVVSDRVQSLVVLTAILHRFANLAPPTSSSASSSSSCSSRPLTSTLWV